MKLVMNWTDEDGEQNDEVCRISLVGSVEHPVITANHDDHGWDGMTGIIQAMKAVAQVNHFEVEIVGEEGV